MLDNLDKKKNPFKVPENYFANFNTEIMDKLPAKNTGNAKIVPLWKKVIPWTAVAAAFAGILFITGIFDRNTTISNPSNTAKAQESAITNGIASSEEEDYYYSFLEDEVNKAQFREMVDNLSN